MPKLLPIGCRTLNNYMLSINRPHKHISVYCLIKSNKKYSTSSIKQNSRLSKFHYFFYFTIPFSENSELYTKFQYSIISSKKLNTYHKVRFEGW